MDHNFHHQITAGLRRHGVNCVTAGEDARAASSDEAILERASQLGRVLVTHDDDFLQIAAERVEQGRTFAGVVYLRQLRLTIGEAVREIELVVHAVSPDEIRNTVIHVPV